MLDLIHFPVGSAYKKGDTSYIELSSASEYSDLGIGYNLVKVQYYDSEYDISLQ